MAGTRTPRPVAFRRFGSPGTGGGRIEIDTGSGGVSIATR
jgi:hypothetical protein